MRIADRNGYTLPLHTPPKGTEGKDMLRTLSSQSPLALATLSILIVLSSCSKDPIQEDLVLFAKQDGYTEGVYEAPDGEDMTRQNGYSSDAITNKTPNGDDPTKPIGYTPDEIGKTLPGADDPTKPIGYTPDNVGKTIPGADDPTKPIGWTDERQTEANPDNDMQEKSIGWVGEYEEEAAPDHDAQMKPDGYIPESISIKVPVSTDDK